MDKGNGCLYKPGLRGFSRVYCGGCKKEMGTLKEEYRHEVGRKITCPCSDEHVARIINNKPGEFWVNLENWIRWYEMHCSPLRLLARLDEFFRKCGRSFLHEWQGPYILVWYIILALLILVSGKIDEWSISSIVRVLLKLGIILLVLWRIWDVIVIGISTSYIRQIPAHRLRSVSFTIASFSQIAMAFSVFYLLVKNDFLPPLGSLEALYLGFVVISTLGYANFTIKNGACIPEMLVIGNILIGIVMLSVLVPIVTQWAGPAWAKELPFSDVKDAGNPAEGKGNGG